MTLSRRMRCRRAAPRHSPPRGEAARSAASRGTYKAPPSKVRRDPAQAFARRFRRLVLAADPSRVTALVYEVEQKRVIDLAAARFVASRIVGELHVANACKIALDRWRKIAFHHLHVVDVVLEKNIVRID